MAISFSPKFQAIRVFAGGRPRRFVSWCAGATALTLSLMALPAWAGDPFRPDNPHNIGDATEATFEAMFYDGDYPEAKALAISAIQSDPAEPMNYAIAAALSYLDNDLDGLANYAEKTQTAADNLMANDPLRGHLYSAVGIFLEGAHVLRTQGIARGTPVALRKLQQVFGQLDEAERINRNDPELSLLKGYMDLLLAVNLPFSDPDQAIGRLANGHPDYLSQRGIALGLRDLGRYPEAMVAVDKALDAAPQNPDLMYLKAQIYRLQGEDAKSLPFYSEALKYEDQLPLSTVRRMKFEQCLAEQKPAEDCAAISGINEE